METMLLVSMNLLTATALGLVILIVHLVKKVEALDRTAADTHAMLLRNLVAQEMGEHPPLNGTPYGEARTLFSPHHD